MAQPVLFEIQVRDGTWRLVRDGDEVRAFGHVEEATHEATGLARALIHTGQPARVLVQAAEDRTIEIDLDEPMRVATPGEDEASAVVPDRGPSA